MASRATTSTEATCSAYESELFAVQYSFQVFHHYLYGNKFILQTDHEALTFLERNAYTNSRPGRLAALLKSCYEFEVEYKKGRLNANADALPRSPARPGISEIHDVGTSVLDAVSYAALPRINMFKMDGLFPDIQHVARPTMVTPAAAHGNASVATSAFSTRGAFNLQTASSAARH